MLEIAQRLFANMEPMHTNKIIIGICTSSALNLKISHNETDKALILGMGVVREVVGAGNLIQVTSTALNCAATVNGER